MVQTWPTTKKALDFLLPYQGILGIAGVVWGVIWGLHLLAVAGMMMRRQTITGSTLRPRSVAEKGTIAQSLREKVWPLIDSGRVAPVMYKTFPLAEAAGAHRLMESSRHIGKIVLTTARA